MSIGDIQDLKKIREIKTKHGLSPYRKTSVEKVILNKINQPKDTLKGRIHGLEMEDEFLLWILMIADIEQVTRLEQKQYVNDGKYIVPDFLLSVSVPKNMVPEKIPSAQRMLVEVKKCKDNELEFNITKKVYQKLRFYSQLYTLPLYFAIKFNTKHIKHWFFVSGKIIEEFAEQKKKKINNRYQDCYSISAMELFKRDMSGMWLNNFTILLKGGTKIIRSYDKNIKKEKANIFDKKLGVNTSARMEYNDKKIEKKLLDKPLALESGIFTTILKILIQKKDTKIKKKKNKTDIIFIANNNYFIPYYHIILNTYLKLRREFKGIQNESDDTLEFYLNNFSFLDINLIILIKKIYYEIVDSGILQPIRMMPDLK